MSEPTAPEQLEAPPVQAAQALKRGVQGFKLPQRVAILALVFGLAGGMLGAYGFVEYFAQYVPVSKKQILVQENSAVIDVAKKVSPSVVSITSKSVSQGFFGNAQQV